MSLAKDPGERYQPASEMMADITRLLSGQHTKAWQFVAGADGAPGPTALFPASSTLAGQDLGTSLPYADQVEAVKQGVLTVDIGDTGIEQEPSATHAGPGV